MCVRMKEREYVCVCGGGGGRYSNYDVNVDWKKEYLCLQLIYIKDYRVIINHQKRLISEIRRRNLCDVNRIFYLSSTQKCSGQNNTIVGRFLHAQRLKNTFENPYYWFWFLQFWVLKNQELYFSKIEFNIILFNTIILLIKRTFIFY